MFSLAFSYSKDGKKDTVETGLAGDNDWTKFAFVTTIPALTQQTYDSTDVILELEGCGAGAALGSVHEDELGMDAGLDHRLEYRRRRAGADCAGFDHRRQACDALWADTQIAYATSLFVRYL